jgi:hypothetical protein
MSRRHYTEEKPPSGAPEQEKGDKPEEGAKVDEKTAELIKKLESKEAEVVDLTVSRFCSYDSFCSFLTSLPLFIGPATVSPRRLYKPAAEFCPREGTDTRLCHYQIRR